MALRELQRQNRLSVERVADDESDAYFASRARGSRIAAWASKQSAPLEKRTDLVTAYAKLRARFAGKDVPRPDFWGGFRIYPERMEFWSSKAHRMHDRVAYLRDGDGWKLVRLYP